VHARIYSLDALLIVMPVLRFKSEAAMCPLQGYKVVEIGRRLNTRSRWLVLACLLTLPAFAQVQPDWTAVKSEIEAIRVLHNLPSIGYSLAVADSIAVADAVGFVNIDVGEEANAYTPYMLASISKTYTATALLQLIEGGTLSLGDRVNDHLPWELDNPRVDGETVRVSHIVTHTSGIRDADIYGSPGSGDLYFFGDSPISLHEIMTGYFIPGGQWYSDNANFRARGPGEEYRYSNFASALAGYLVESVSGTALRDHSIANLFNPLGMLNTGWELADFADTSKIAMPYYGNGDPIGHFSYPDYPSGQLRTSPNDVGIYMAMLLGGGQPAGGVRVLQPETVDLGFDDVFVDHADQGVMWYSEYNYGERNACHAGSDFGVSTELCLMLESGLGFAVFVNSGSDQAFTAIYKVRDLLFDQGQLLLGNLPTPPLSTPPALASGGGGQPSLLFLFLLFAITLTRYQYGR